jgi:hypothetical protein
MTDFDLDRLGDVWRQPPDAAELARLERTALGVARRARLSNVVDIAAGIAVSLVVLTLIVANPRPQTIVVGSAAILVLLVSNVRLRKLRLVELKSLTGSTEDMLAQSIARVEATRKNARFSLIALGPALLLGWLLMYAVWGSPDRSAVPHLFQTPAFRFLWNGGWAVVAAGIVVGLLLTLRRCGRELERLVAMRESYVEERNSTLQ